MHKRKLSSLVELQQRDNNPCKEPVQGTDLNHLLLKITALTLQAHNSSQSIAHHYISRICFLLKKNLTNLSTKTSKIFPKLNLQEVNHKFLKIQLVSMRAMSKNKFYYLGSGTLHYLKNLKVCVHQTIAIILLLVVDHH